MTISAQRLSRRVLLRGTAWSMAGVAIGALERAPVAAAESADLAAETFAFVRRCGRSDGGYAPSPDPTYKGYSDTSLSDLAGVTYAATLAKTMDWQLPQPKRSIAFLHRHQQPDGAFMSKGGTWDPKSDLAVLYSTVQAVVALRARRTAENRSSQGHGPLLRRQSVSEAAVVHNELLPAFLRSPGKAVSGTVQPGPARAASPQPEGRWLPGDHVAATFHMAHYFRLIGQSTPKAAQMVRRVLRDQKPDGGWNVREPDWDVHACFDAVFILRQLGGKSEAVRRAIQKGRLGLGCRNADGGFGHYPGRHSDMDAVYFQFGTFIQAGRLPAAKLDLPDGHTLSWGHAMQPDKVY